MSELTPESDYTGGDKSKKKLILCVMENTKEYICRAMVTVVDHLGNVSSNLEGLISHTNSFSDAEIKIQCLKQRLFSCEQYADKLSISNMQWREKLPRFHTRYLSSSPILEKSQENLKPATATNNKHNNLAFVMPVRDGLKVLAKVSNPTFHFQATPKVGPRHRRSLHGSDILWLIRRTKHTH
ncbi:probable protein ABIL5 [Vicia villosa]|uniref:probable protein ABIL5 n=1 Tax=Vicia villosa TaxID=3911 RepID=UPI00273BA2CC|nr:probable protein ABIL5 [Vicia villosa]